MHSLAKNNTWELVETTPGLKPKYLLLKAKNPAVVLKNLSWEQTM